MFFYIAKIGWFLIQPSTALLLVTGIGGALVLADRWRRAARPLLWGGLAGLAVVGFSPLGNLVILPLEERFPAPEPSTLEPDGIIVLGGSFTPSISAARGSVEVNEAGERLLALVFLARRYPEARLVFTGGSGDLMNTGPTEAAIAVRLFDALGLDPGRIAFEDRSRNTWQNAVFTRDLVDPATDETWLVVTSAWHMPRAVGAFRAAGFPVAAWPVDYRTRGWSDAGRFFDTASEGLRRMDLATREWVGLVAYWMTGRSSALLPGPYTDHQ